MTDHLSDMYDGKYEQEKWLPMTFHPQRLSTHRYDDVYRLLLHEHGCCLDVGCGSGQLLLGLARGFSSAIGLDISKNRIHLARRMTAEYYPDLQGHVTFVIGRADEPLPFESAFFDVVIACAVLEHVVDLFTTMDELARVCKPGGCLVVTVPNICYVKHACSLLLGRAPRTGGTSREAALWRREGWDGGHLHYFSKATLTDLLRHVGFEPELWTSDGRWAKLRRWNANFCGNLTVRSRRVCRT